MVSVGELLLSRHLYRDVIDVYWKIIRRVIFNELESYNIGFQGTDDAIKEFVLYYKTDKELGSELIFLESIALFCNWDSTFVINYAQVKEYQTICFKFIYKLGIPINSEREVHYELLKEEVNRHIEDLYLTKSQQFSASKRYERLYKLFLFIGFAISTLSLSAFFYVFMEDRFESVGGLIMQAVTLVGFIATVWPLVRDYSGKSVVYRQFADEYGRLYKMSRNWITEFPDSSRLQEATNMIHLIRNMAITINSLTPSTKEKDYKRAKNAFEKYKDEILI